MATTYGWIANRINQQSLKGTELTLCYRCLVICNSKRETHIRALLLQMLNNSTMKLRSLHSGNSPDDIKKVEVTAELITQERNDAFLEQVVSTLSLESDVSAVNWKITEEIYG